VPEHETVPCPKCSSMATQTSNTRSAWGAPTLKWSCRTCGKVAYDSEAQRLLAEQQRKRRQHEREMQPEPEPTPTPAPQEATTVAKNTSQPASQQPQPEAEVPEPPEAQAAPVATPSPAPVAVPPALTEAELEARYAALQQARSLRAERDEMAAGVAMLQRKLAELETDVAYAMRRALAPVGAP